VRILFDTSVWVDHLRTGALDQIIPRLRGRFLLWMDAVSAAELLAGCRSRTERRAITKLLSPFQRAGRLARPEFSDFDKAAVALSRLREKGRTLKNPGGALLDGLIAAICCRVGGLLVTTNTRDFEALSLHLPLRFRTLDDLETRLT
jgi:predicted nucleic acid-binding protein